MAEETDVTQKPKVQLIKQRPAPSAGEVRSPAESGDPKPADGVAKSADQQERKQVIKVPPAAPASSGAPATAAAAVPVKRVKKVVAIKGTQASVPPVAEQSPPRAQLVPSDSPALVSAEVSQPAVSAETPAPAAAVPPEAPASTEPAPAAQAAVDHKPAPTPEKKEGAPFALTQRPMAAAGKVGGRYVGPRPPFDNQRGNHGAPRPGGFVPRGGNGFRPGGFDNRGSGGAPRPGGYPNRQFNGPPGSSGGPRPFGNRPPNGPGGNRPFGGPGRPFGGPRPGGFGSGSPPPLTEGKGPAKKSFKAKKPVYTRKEKEQEMAEKLLQTKKKITQVANPVPKSIEIMEVISVSELARKMNLRASDLIQKLMSLGQMVTINQQIDSDTATILAGEFGADVKVVSLYDESLIETASDEGAQMSSRPPVVTVMGHVDHGKTKLLDAIRSADVVSGEFGGITQHIGAYTVESPKGKITFLDTPGHEAFTRMRARGAQVTDIVVLVVAADDGVMPQTIEALSHAKEADVPIIVAVNKIDKPEANPDRVKTQLSEHDLIPEDWGGQTMFVEISALRKEGIDKLIDAILLQAEILDLKANYNRNAEGKVLESRIDHGRGIVATVMIECGTLAIGDSFVAGVWSGKVRALFTDKGEKVEKATPATPIEVLGFEGIPNAGDPLQVVEDEKVARTFSAKRQELKRFEDAKNIRKITLDNLHDTINEGAIQELKVIIKADVQGSAEALRSSLEKLSTREVRLHVIQALPGAINEGDVDLAIASNAIIIGFNVRPVPKAKILADQEKVDVRRYNVIYKAVEEIQQAMEGMLKPDVKEEVIATVEVRDTFKTPKFGTIAGCYVLTGTVKRSAGIHLIRESIVIHTGKIGSLRRFKDDAREVAAGFECGIGLEAFNDLQVGDQFEVFEMVEVARKLSSSK